MFLLFVIQTMLINEHWLKMYGSCTLILSKFQIESLRMFKEARATLTSFAALLNSSPFANLSGNIKGLLFYFFLS